MQAAVRENVPAVTAVLSLVSLALVFGAAGQQLPTAILPEAPEAVLDAIPHVNAAISTVAIVTIGLGWQAAREGEIDRHRRLMATSFGLFALFLVLYLYRVAILGPHPFPGPATVEQFVYLPVLAVHVFLAVVCIPLLYYALLLAATRPVYELRESLHPRVGRVAAALWLTSFFLGVVVYAFLYVIY